MILVWLLIRGMFALLVAICDDLLVLVRLKWRPPMGKAKWRWSTDPTCIGCGGPLEPCDCHAGCPGSMCPECERQRIQLVGAIRRCR